MTFREQGRRVSVVLMLVGVLWFAFANAIGIVEGMDARRDLLGLPAQFMSAGIVLRYLLWVTLKGGA